ncbi:MAG: EamA family transporter [Leptospiraceae bacterium]|nr:EamA family transporter [Leptospiraceae bacterium]MCP5510500.1 EamA family transporter [Leptospiraceae bacterium]
MKLSQERIDLWVGSFLVLLSAITFSSKAIFVKLYYRVEIDVLSALFLRMIFALPFFVLALLIDKIRRQTPPLEKKDKIWIVFLGFFGYYLSSYLDFQGLTLISASLERLILFSYPTLVVILSFFVFKTPITKKEVISLSLTYTGIGIVFYSEDILKSSEKWEGALYVFLCAITYSIYLLGSGKMIKRVGSVRFTNTSMIVACVFVIFHYLLVKGMPVLESFSKDEYTIGFLMAIFSTVIPSYLLFWGMKKIGSEKAAIINSIGPVSTIAMAYCILDEQVKWQEFPGVILIILGVLWISFRK